MAVLTYKSMPKQCEDQGMKTQRVGRKEDRGQVLDWKRRGWGWGGAGEWDQQRQRLAHLGTIIDRMLFLSSQDFPRLWPKSLLGQFLCS